MDAIFLLVVLMLFVASYALVGVLVRLDQARTGERP